jgi:hypothetical protein
MLIGNFILLRRCYSVTDDDQASCRCPESAQLMPGKRNYVDRPYPYILCGQKNITTDTAGNWRNTECYSRTVPGELGHITYAVFCPYYERTKELWDLHGAGSGAGTLSTAAKYRDRGTHVAAGSTPPGFSPAKLGQLITLLHSHRRPNRPTTPTRGHPA